MKWLFNNVPFWAIGIIFFVVMIVVSRVLTWILPKSKFTSKSTPRPLSQPKQTNAGCLVVFGGVFVLAGMVTLFATTIRPAYRASRATNWPTTAGVVVSSALKTSSSSNSGRSYAIDIHFTYQVAGQVYEGKNYDSSSGSSSLYRAAKLTVVEQHRPGMPVTVHYDPSDPSDAMLSIEIPPGTFSMVWFPLIFCAVGGGIMFASRYIGRPQSPMAGAVGTTQTSFRSRRGGGFVGALVFTTIWCAITGLLDSRSNAPFFFKIMFSAISILLILMTVYQFLGLFNPGLSIEFAKMPIHPGETVEATFRVIGNFQKIRSLAIVLEGRESATYTVGTNSHTQTYVAWRFPLVDTVRAVDMERGKMKIALPPDAMPTFMASNNKFTWVLVCSGDIPRRPDIKDEFKIAVVSAGAVS